MTLSITHPPLLARGSYNPASGVGCIMNLVCWIKNVPADQVGDEPDGYLHVFQQLLIRVNDSICTNLRLFEIAHVRGEQYLGETIPTTWSEAVELNCVSCSSNLLDWAFYLDRSDWLVGAMDDHSHCNGACDNKPRIHPQELRKLQRLLNEAEHVLRTIPETTMYDLRYYADDLAKTAVPGNFQTLEEVMSERGTYNYLVKRADKARKLLVRKMDHLAYYVDHLTQKYNPLPPIRTEIANLLPAAVLKYGIQTASLSS